MGFDQGSKPFIPIISFKELMDILGFDLEPKIRCNPYLKDNWINP